MKDEDEGPGEDWDEYGVKTKKLWEATRLGQAAGTPLEDIVRGIVRHPGEGLAWRVGDKSGCEEGLDRGSEVVGENMDCPSIHSPFLGED